MAVENKAKAAKPPGKIRITLWWFFVVFGLQHILITGYSLYKYGFAPSAANPYGFGGILICSMFIATTEMFHGYIPGSMEFDPNELGEKMGWIWNLCVKHGMPYGTGLSEAYTWYAWTLIPVIFCFFYFLPFMFSHMGVPKAQKTRKKITPVLDHVRGMTRVSQEQLVKMCKAIPQLIDSGLWIHPAIPWARSAPTEHTFLIGSTGAGKTESVLNFQYKQAAARPGDHRIIMDKKGDFTEALAGQPGVTIIAPWDDRSARWDIGSEIQSYADCDMLAEAVVPPARKGEKSFFRNTAVELLSAVAKSLFNKDGLSWGNLDKILADQEAAHKLLSTYERTMRAARSIEPGGSDSSSDILKTLDTNTRWLFETSKAWDNQPDFTLREWLDNPEGGTLILRYSENYPVLSSSICSIVAAYLFSLVLAKSDQKEKLYWFFLDELQNLPAMHNLVQALSEIRSKGGAITISCQDLGRLRDRYGDSAESIMNCCNTHAYFVCPDAKTAEYLSRSLGDMEEIKTTFSESENSGYSSPDSMIPQGHANKSSGQSSSMSADLREKKVVLPGEIQSLRVGQAFLKLRGLPVAKVTWPQTILERLFAKDIIAPWVHERDTPITDDDYTEESETVTADAAIDETEVDSDDGHTEPSDDMLDEIEKLLGPGSPGPR